MALPSVAITPPCLSHQLPYPLDIALTLSTLSSHLLSIVTNSISYPESMAQEIEKQCQPIFPLQNCYIRKVKVLKKPRFDLTKLMEMHSGMGEDKGAQMDKADAEKKEKLAGAGGRL